MYCCRMDFVEYFEKGAEGITLEEICINGSSSAFVFAGKQVGERGY